jgi:SAM-dependent methyltransferase
MPYVYSLPTLPSYTAKGLSGYGFGPLKHKDIMIDYIDVQRGHDTFMVSNNVARTYYVISGNGYFTIDKTVYPVSSGMLVEVPTKIEYCYSGKMNLILFQRGRWFAGNDIHTKWNPDVVQEEFPDARRGRYSLQRLASLRVFKKSPIGVYLRLNRALWNAVPSRLTAVSPIRAYGRFLHALVRIEGNRGQLFDTYFLRNRAALDMIRRLVQRSQAATLRVAVLGCSTGAEAYSVAWTIRSARPNLGLIFQAVDISARAVEVAQAGKYSLVVPQSIYRYVFDGVTSSEIAELFDKEGDAVTVKSWIREGIEWHVGDVRDPGILDMLGPQDIVVANNFLCHMDPQAAERSLRNIARLIKPNGYLFVSGIDLNIRTKVARELGWHPLQEALEDMHEGDPRMLNHWPWHYSALEPLNKKRKDWRLRYASVFQLERPSDAVEKGV